MNQFCDMKGIKREFSVARTPQQNGVAERKNRTLIEAARTMLVDFKLPTTFWAEAVNSACYVLNRALVIKPYNKTPYELIRRRPPLIDFMKPCGKAMRVYNKKTRIVEETLNIRFLENAPNVKGNGPDWLFYIDSLTISMNYVPVVTGFQTNGIGGTKDNIVASQAEKKKKPEQEYTWIPICTADPLISQGPKDSAVDVGKKATEVHESQVSDNGGQDDQVTRSEFEGLLQQERQTEHINSTNSFNTVSLPVNTVGPSLLMLLHHYQLMLLELLLTTSTPMEPNKALVKDAEAEDVDVHLYKSMIGSLMYLTASRPGITFVVCACARFQVTSKTSHLHGVKRIFRYLKGQPKLELWYPRDSPFNLEAYSDSDYAGAILDRKSTTGCCQFLGKRLILWQCKKQTIVVKSTTKAEYVAVASCCGRVLWIQNQMLDYGFNLMNTKIYIDNESAIYIMKNLVFHCKTKHIEIRNHFIIDSYEKKLIQVIKIHTDHHVADLLTKDFDVSRYALTVNPTVYASCVKQFWTTAKVKKVNGQEQIQALVDRQEMKPKRKQRQATEVHSPSSEILVEESIPTPSNDPLPSGEDSIQLNELMIFYTNLQQHVLDLEEAKTAQAKEIGNLKERVKKLEKRRKSRPTGLRRLKKVGSSNRVESSEEKDSLVDDLEGTEVFVDVREKIVEKEVSTANLVTPAGEVVIAASVEDNVAPTTATTIDVDDELTMAKTLITIKATKQKIISTAATTVTTAITTPRAKGIIFHEQVQAHIPTISSSKDKGKAKMIEPEKPLKKKDRIALDEEVARRQLAKQIQAQEREQLSIEERSKLLAELIKSRRKYFATKRAEEIRNKPPTKAQQKRQELEQESTKKQKLAEQEQAKVADDDTVELKRCLEIVLEDDDDVAIEATPLSSKSPTIVDYNIYREGKKIYFKIIRADGNSQNYLTFGTMLSIISYSKTRKYIQRGCQFFLAQVTEKKTKDKSEEKRLKDVPIVQDFPEVFREDFPRLPPTRKVEFQINLVPGVAPVARAPYRLVIGKRIEANLHELILKNTELILIFCPKVEMGRDVLTVVSTMRIPLLYRGEYSQWFERFMNYLEEQTDGEAMINSIRNGDQPLPRVTQVSIANYLN
uniref:Integrase catalytic domain-containing protein n=1 Tax=Tanacetum cinerariifolium TaxID=118510 RepID=A0A6L2P1Y0_TANCI|nr:hypothetical protein [Tanacetum cinerariifolium]